MGILSGPEILRQVELGAIVIDPFDPAMVGPNSYDVRLGDTLLLMEDRFFNLTTPPEDVLLTQIPADGILLHVGKGYLAHTIERIGCQGFVPWIDGRSTVGRYFLQVHQTAGRGDDGFGPASFTLELMPMYRPVVVYAGLAIAQVSFFRLEGERQPYGGRYQSQTGPTPPKPLRRN